MWTVGANSLVAVHGPLSAVAPLAAEHRFWVYEVQPGFDPWVGKIPWRREGLPTPVFLPGEFHGQRGYSPWGCKMLDMTEQLTLPLLHRFVLWPWAKLSIFILFCFRNVLEAMWLSYF